MWLSILPLSEPPLEITGLRPMPQLWGSSALLWLSQWKAGKQPQTWPWCNRTMTQSVSKSNNARDGHSSCRSQLKVPFPLVHRRGGHKRMGLAPGGHWYPVSKLGQGWEVHNGLGVQRQYQGRCYNDVPLRGETRQNGPQAPFGRWSLGSHSRPPGLHRTLQTKTNFYGP